jgi:hypothetical protein
MSATTIAAGSRARPRPGLAVLLALLGVPGSTVAWSLPSGGLWIGLPLAVAAIAIGLRAAGTWLAAAAIVLGAAEILFMAIWTVAEVVAG